MTYFLVYWNGACAGWMLAILVMRIRDDKRHRARVAALARA